MCHPCMWYMCVLVLVGTDVCTNSDLHLLIMLFLSVPFRLSILGNPTSNILNS